VECLDPGNAFGDHAGNEIGNAGKCHSGYCTINILRFYECEPGAPSSGCECKWKSATAADGGTWSRKHMIYKQACTTANTGAAPYDPANDDRENWTCKQRGHGSGVGIPSANGEPGWTTPCLATSGCGTGAHQNTNDSSASYQGRRICDTP
jgi:hypothetical protein